MANTNAPYGFRLWGRLTGGTGATVLAPGKAAGGTPSSSGQVPVRSAAVLAIGDPIHVSLGLGYLATGTQAIYGVCNSAVPGWGETAIQRHYPEIIPADDKTIFRCQSIGTVNVTQALLGMASRRFRIGGTTSGYTGINMTVATTGYGCLQALALAPGSVLGTYAELLVMAVRGAFYGAV